MSPQTWVVASRGSLVREAKLEVCVLCLPWFYKALNGGHKHEKHPWILVGAQLEGRLEANRDNEHNSHKHPGVLSVNVTVFRVSGHPASAP